MALEQEGADPDGDVLGLLSAQLEPAKGTALHEACRAGNVDVVRLLLLRGAPADLRDAQGKAAFEVASAECPAQKFGAVRAAFEAELFKRCASGDTAGAEALAYGGLDLACEQAGYSPWAWANLFEQTATAQRIEDIASGRVEAREAEQVPNGDSGPATVQEEQPVKEEARPKRRFRQGSDPQLLIWPPCRAHRWPSEASEEIPKLLLIFGRTSPLQVHLPALGLPAAAAVLRYLAACLELVSAEGTAAFGAQLLVPVARCPPSALLPHDLKASPADGEDGYQPDNLVLPSAIDLCLDASMATGTFRLKLTGSSTSGHVEIAGADAVALRLGIGQLRQLLLLHGQPASQGLCLPAVCLQATASQGSAVYLDIWKLPAEEQDLTLGHLLRWRIEQIWIPLPVGLLGSCAGQLAGRKAEFLRRIFQARLVCDEGGAELVPLVTEPWQAAPELLVEFLAQFQGCRQLGLRLAKTATQQVTQMRHLAALAGLGCSTLVGCIPMEDAHLVEDVCQLVVKSAGHGALAPRIALLLERSEASDEAEDEDFLDAVGLAAAYGVPVGTMVRASSASAPPLYVWHRQGIEARAVCLARLCRAAHAAGGDAGACCVVEVPLFAAPWCGAGTAWPSSWCSLTAFLAAGITRQPDVALSHLGLGQASSGGSGRLAELLQGQLLRPAPPGESSSSRAAMAKALWDSPSAASDAMSTALMESLLGLLGGRAPVLGNVRERDAVVVAANAWYAQLTERRQALRAFCPGTAPAAQLAPEASMPEAHAMLAAALVGLEWLRFACRLLLLLAKHAPERKTRTADAESNESQLQELREGMKALPPTKGSDVRNGFLALVHRTVSGAVDLPETGWWEDADDAVSPAFGSSAAADARRLAAEALWSGGLRLGAALDLQPWASLASTS
eukprot:TRINITY_DN92645_c0_g1_i1.p1 TRINITY_DN92645_c0_g1~~TRINITY_DN92645_c0_g1_i1.p1  ORF type:complete len:943 (+),score=197.60 TRINITY_DN92645_c0_g1_i1:115-2829(+)